MKTNDWVRLKEVLHQSSCHDPNVIQGLKGGFFLPDNLMAACKKVVSNRGAPGVDNMLATSLPGHLMEHWPGIRADLVSSRYRPQPLRTIEVAKRGGNGIRRLRVPTVLDRFIQTGLLLQLDPILDPTFSNHSYGYRSGLSVHDALLDLEQTINLGFDWVLHLDIKDFFDDVGHGILWKFLEVRVHDPWVSHQLRVILKSTSRGSRKSQGIPQGSPLSPLFANLVLDYLDRDLEGRGVRFMRYADDCVICCRSMERANREWDQVRNILHRKLGLKLNEEKTHIVRPERLEYLGFTFFRKGNGRFGRTLAAESVLRFKDHIQTFAQGRKEEGKEHDKRTVDSYLVSWFSHYGRCEQTSLLKSLKRYAWRVLGLNGSDFD